MMDFVPEGSCEEEEEVGSPPRRVSVALPVMGQQPGAHPPPTFPSICVPWVESVTLTNTQ